MGPCGKAILLPGGVFQVNEQEIQGPFRDERSWISSPMYLLAVSFFLCFETNCHFTDCALGLIGFVVLRFWFVTANFLLRALAFTCHLYYTLKIVGHLCLFRGTFCCVEIKNFFFFGSQIYNFWTWFLTLKRLSHWDYFLNSFVFFSDSFIALFLTLRSLIHLLFPML